MCDYSLRAIATRPAGGRGNVGLYQIPGFSNSRLRKSERPASCSLPSSWD
jgi:hypothetical protein